MEGRGSEKARDTAGKTKKDVECACGYRAGKKGRKRRKRRKTAPVISLKISGVGVGVGRTRGLSRSNFNIAKHFSWD